ncbi:MAG: conjugal transfer protein TraF [Pseudomonadota bacterium]|nr:conjugal transfer protein TraF [Pseudomonadota bacterium]
MKTAAHIGFLAAVWTAVAPVCANDGFYERAGEGWFWYEDPPSIPHEAPPEVSVEAPVQVAVAAPAESPAEPPGPPPLSAAWLKTALPEYRMRAIEEPSQENVRAYLYLQRVTLDKSTEFARMVKTVTIGDPYLDEIACQPSANYATHTLSRSRDGNTAEVLGQVARRVGLFFFFASDCDLCDAQAEVLEILERNHGFAVKAVSLDGRPLEGGRYPGYATDRGQACRFACAVATCRSKPARNLGPDDEARSSMR